MKKNFRTLAFAIAVMGLAIACNNNANEETTDSVIDSTPVVIEEVMDTTPVVEEVATPTTPKKAATKNETKEEVGKNDASKVSIGDASTTVTIKKGGVKVVKGDNKKAPDASKMTIEGKNGSVSTDGNTATVKIKK